MGIIKVYIIKNKFYELYKKLGHNKYRVYDRVGHSLSGWFKLEDLEKVLTCCYGKR